MTKTLALLLVVVAGVAAGFACGTTTITLKDVHVHPVSGKPTGLPAAEEGEQSGLLRAQSDRPPDLPEPDPLRELPELEDPVIFTTVNGGDSWHFQDGRPRDNTGDGWMAVVEVDGEREYWIVMRQGTHPPGGVFYRKKWDGDPTQGWVTQLDAATKAIPRFQNSPSMWNIDTHSFEQNPRTKLVTFTHFSKPGYYWPDPPHMSSDSETGFIQRATSMTGGKTPNNYARWREDFLIQPEPELNPYENIYHRGNTYQGGSCEQSIVIAPPYALLFWEHKTWGDPDWTGQVFKGRIHRAWCWLKDLDDAAPFQRLPGENYVFDPEEARLPDRSTNNDNALWGTANVTLRAGITMNPNDNILHMVYQAGRPQVRHDGRPANGKVNDSMGLAHCWSDDYGWHWNWDDGNPMYWHKRLPGYVDNGTANRLNSPFILFDVHAKSPEFPHGTGWLIFWGNPIDTMNQVGTRLWGMRFKL